MHIQTDENSVTLTPFGPVAQNAGSAAHRSEENIRHIVEPADFLMAVFVIVLTCVLLIAFVF